MRRPAQSDITWTMRISLLLLAAVGVCGAASSAGVEEPHVAIRATVAALEQIPLPGDPKFDIAYDVPEAARPLLTKLKHQLRELILATLNAAPQAAPDPDRLTAQLVETLNREGVPVGKENVPKSQSYGGILDVRIEQPAGHQHLLAATTKIQIPCSGGDTSLYVFRRKGVRWGLVLAVESNDYAQVNGAQDLFSYVISPNDAHGKWFVVTAHNPAWCTSCWSGGLEYRVLRPGRAPDTPVVLLKEKVGIYRCAEPPYKLLLEPGGFRVDYVAGNWLEFELFTAVQVDRYTVSGRHVRRIAPIAYLPQNFVNAWLQLPWQEAARWSNQAKAASLRDWHDLLQPGNNGWRPAGIDFVQSCDKAKSKWQIGLSSESGTPPKVLFLTVTREDDSFILERIDIVRPPGCPGETPPVRGSPDLSLP